MSQAPPAPISSLNPDVTAPASRWDRLGIIASVGCAVHCLAAPFLLLLLPTLSSVWSHPAAHWILGALVLPLAAVVVWRGYRLHRKRLALVAMGLGAVFIVAGLILPELPASGGVASASTEAAHVDQTASTFGTTAAAPVAACTDAACCPTIVQDAQTGSFSMTIPPAGFVTIIGSVLLVLAHSINLWGCHCFTRHTTEAAGTCGCPTHASN